MRLVYIALSMYQSQIGENVLSTVWIVWKRASSEKANAYERPVYLPTGAIRRSHSLDILLDILMYIQITCSCCTSANATDRTFHSTAAVNCQRSVLCQTRQRCEHVPSYMSGRQQLPAPCIPMNRAPLAGSLITCAVKTRYEELRHNHDCPSRRIPNQVAQRVKKRLDWRPRFSLIRWLSQLLPLLDLLVLFTRVLRDLAHRQRIERLFGTWGIPGTPYSFLPLLWLPPRPGRSHHPSQETLDPIQKWRFA
jgi:hypothetical protein